MESVGDSWCEGDEGKCTGETHVECIRVDVLLRGMKNVSYLSGDGSKM